MTSFQLAGMAKGRQVKLNITVALVGVRLGDFTDMADTQRIYKI